MGERTTFAVKCFSVFILAYIAMGVLQLYYNNFSIEKYDSLAVFGLLLISFFLLIINNVFGWILSFICVLWLLFNPMNMPFLNEGILFIFLKNPVFVNNLVFIELVIWSLMLIIVLVSMIMKFAKKRSYAFETIMGIYIILFSVGFTSGFLNSFLTYGFIVKDLIIPGIVLFSFILLFVIGYFISPKEVSQ